MNVLFQLIFWFWIFFFTIYIIGILKEKDSLHFKKNCIIFIILSLLTILIIVYDIEREIFTSFN